MRKRFVKITALIAVTLGVAFGVKAYDGKESSKLLSSNLKALTSEPVTKDASFYMHCNVVQDWQSTCMAECPMCRTKWEISSHGYGAYLTGICPRCGYDFGD